MNNANQDIFYMIKLINAFNVLYLEFNYLYLHLLRLVVKNNVIKFVEMVTFIMINVMIKILNLEMDVANYVKFRININANIFIIIIKVFVLNLNIKYRYKWKEISIKIKLL